MKIKLIACIIGWLVLSCNSGSRSNKVPPLSGSNDKALQKDSPLYVNNPDSIPTKKAYVLTNNILGTWALAGTDNASFVIEKKKITYPETFTSYSYILQKDSLKISYDDYVGAFFIRMRSNDTLILAGDEVQIFYRVKK